MKRKDEVCKSENAKIITNYFSGPTKAKTKQKIF